MRGPHFEIDLDRLWSDIALYLEFLELAQDEHWLWAEYVAWKKLTDRREKIKASV